MKNKMIAWGGSNPPFEDTPLSHPVAIMQSLYIRV